MQKIGIQGYEGSFHHMAVAAYFSANEDISIVPFDTFDALGVAVKAGTIDLAAMAIENSIAGTLLQNYRILREYQLYVIGEHYLRIQHQLLANHLTAIDDIKEVHSHPMAINQCLQFLNPHHWTLIAATDTALSAKALQSTPHKAKACIASRLAANIYDLNILAENIETHPLNYTRFFIISAQPDYPPIVNKASLYLRIPDKRGSILRVLQHIDQLGLNMSKLQSYPATGHWRSYYFHIDIEFMDVDQYESLREILQNTTAGFNELGRYQAHHFAIKH